MLRLNKYLSAAGICSRREADRLIEAGEVYVDGKCAVPGMKVEEGQEIRVRGQLVRGTADKVVLAVHKPAGIVCTEEKREKNNIIDFLKYPIRVTYAGRLDKESEGLLIMTNDGDLINRMMRARYAHEKEYQVTVDHPLSDAVITALSEGVHIRDEEKDLDEVTRPCKVTRTGSCTFTIVLTQGLNRQIRRMCEALGYRVTRLVRVRIMNVRLGDLPIGGYREIKGQELDRLYEQAKANAGAGRTSEQGI